MSDGEGGHLKPAVRMWVRNFLRDDWLHGAFRERKYLSTLNAYDTELVSMMLNATKHRTEQELLVWVEMKLVTERLQGS